MIKYFLLLVSGFLLAGCIPLYKGPSPDSATAKVRFVSHADIGATNINVNFFNSEKDVCNYDIEKSQIVASLNGIRITHNRKDLSIPLGDSFPKESKTEVEVKTGEPLYYSIGYAVGSVCFSSIAIGCTGSSSCVVGANFIPKANHLYEVTYDIKDKQCISQAFELIKNDQSSYTRVVEPTTHQVECK